MRNTENLQHRLVNIAEVLTWLESQDQQSCLILERRLIWKDALFVLAKKLLLQCMLEKEQYFLKWIEKCEISSLWLKICQFKGMNQEYIFSPEVAPVRNREISNAA